MTGEAGVSIAIPAVGTGLHCRGVSRTEGIVVVGVGCPLAQARSAICEAPRSEQDNALPPVHRRQVPVADANGGCARYALEIVGCLGVDTARKRGILRCSKKSWGEFFSVGSCNC